MLPNNVVSFMKKIVKNAESGHQENPMAAGNKLTRLKQTLTTGLQQAQDSVAKFSPKSIHVGVGDIANRRLSSKDPSNDESTLSSDNALDKDASNSTHPSSALLNTIGTSGGGTKSCPGPPNRLTSCRVCVRSLSIGNSDVSYRICSQCNLKVCEDCASYSNLDNDIDKTFWRCSVCRRKNQDTPSSIPTSASGAGAGVNRQAARSSAAHHRWSEEKPVSLSITSDDYSRKSLEANPPTPGSAPVSRRERRSTSGESGVYSDRKHSTALVQPSLQVDLSKRSLATSIDNIYNFNGTRGGGSADVSGHRITSPGRKANRLDQPHEARRSISASESSPEDANDQQHRHYDGRDSGCAGSLTASSSSRRSTCDVVHYGESSSRRSSCRQSFQKQSRGDQSLYLSADDAACLSPWSQQRRYSSESSDASESGATAPGTPRRPSQEDPDEFSSSGYGSSLVPSSRRRLSFRSNRTRHLYDADGADGFVSDEQQQQQQQLDANSVNTTTTLTTETSPSRASRRSCSDISQLDNGPDLATAAAAGTTSGSQYRSHSPRGSIGVYDGIISEERLGAASHRRISTQLSDPPPSLSRSQSPRPSIASSRGGSDRRSIEREAIRIVIDDVDCSTGSQQQQPTVTKTGATPSSSSTVITYLHRDPSYGVGHGFTDGFGLTLTSRKNVIITWIDPHGPADRAGLCVGDIVISWDGVQLVGRNFDDVKQELQHSGDSIQIQVLRNVPRADDTSHPANPHEESSSHQPMRPNKLTSSVLILDGSSGRSTPPSPTRRRLPQAPVASFKTTTADQVGPQLCRVQLKFKCNVERNGSICMEISVLSAEKPSIEGYNEENAFGWIQMVLNLPSGASRKFVTDRVESAFGLRWNSLFTCSDMSTEEVSRSQLTVSLWADYFQRGETKLAESTLELENITMDARPTWFNLRQSDGQIYTTPRRLSKAMSHDIQNQQQQQQQQQLYSRNASRNSSEMSVDRSSQSPTSPYGKPPISPGSGLPRSRSAEICDMLLQPEAPAWASSGLSAPASLAPSRRGSSYNCDEELKIPQSSPSSRRGSSVFMANDPQMENFQLVHEKLSLATTSSQPQHGAPSAQWRSQSFRTDMTSQLRTSHDLPSNWTSQRILNTSSLELGAGQIVPDRLCRGRDDGVFYTTESCGQIKLGLIIIQGQLEVEIMTVRNLPMVGENGTAPDTYVKVTLCDKNRIFSKRKTRTMRQTCHPEFHQTLLFDACNALGATLIVELKLKDDIGGGKSIRHSSAISPTGLNAKQSFGQKNQSTLGLVYVALDRLALATLTISWYRLIPISMGSMRDEFPFDDSSP